MRLLYGAILSALIILFVPHFIEKFRRWDSFHVDVPLAPEAWRELEGEQQPCPTNASSTRDCAASPADRDLWNSNLSRLSAHKVHLASERRVPYWIGVEVPAATLTKAHSLRASQLLLGWIHSSYRIWVDGHLIMSGHGERDQHPIVLTLPLDRLAQNRPLDLAVLIYRDTEQWAPDQLNLRHGGEGFVTADTAESFRDVVTFWDTVRPFSLLIAYLVIASFFSSWLRTRAKTEFFYIALFALASAFLQARMTTIFAAAVSREAGATIDVIVRFWIAAFGMALGFSFARTRLAFFKWGVPIAAALPFVTLAIVPDSHLRHQLIAALRDWATPAAYVLGAAACFLQALHLIHGARVRAHRALRLALFGLGLTGVASFQILQDTDLVPRPRTRSGSAWASSISSSSSSSARSRPPSPSTAPSTRCRAATRSSSTAPRARCSCCVSKDRKQPSGSRARMPTR